MRSQSNPWSPADLLSQVRHITCMAKPPYVYLWNNIFYWFLGLYRYLRHYYSVDYNGSIPHISSKNEPRCEKNGPRTENNSYSLKSARHLWKIWTPPTRSDPFSEYNSQHRLNNLKSIYTHTILYWEKRSLAGRRYLMALSTPRAANRQRVGLTHS